MPQPIQTAMTTWPRVFDLEECNFSYKGRTVPGAKLAQLLGLVGEEGEVGVWETGQLVSQLQELLAWLKRERPPVKELASREHTEEMIRRSEESLSRDEGEPLGDIIARLKGGGPLTRPG